MKTLKMTPIFMFLMLVTAFAMSACGKSSNNSAVVANQACSTTPNSYGNYGNTGIYGNTGTYYVTGTATPVAASQCASVNGVATNGATTYGAGQFLTGQMYGPYPVAICNGRPMVNARDGAQGVCGVTGNCSGGLYIDQQTGQTVVCQ